MAVLAGLVVAVLGAWAVVGLAGSDDPTGEAVSAGPSAGSTESATSGVASTVASTTTTTTEPPTTTTTAQVPGSQLPPGPNTVYVLGDSVTLGAQNQVPAALPGWDVTFDAKESRRIDQGIGIVQSQGGAVGRVLVVHLCTNWGGGDYRAAAEQLLGSLDGVDRVVWVTCTPWNGAVGEADAVITSLPESHPQVVVADWGAVSGTPGYTYSDDLHLQTPGAEALGQLIADALGPAPAPA